MFSLLTDYIAHFRHIASLRSTLTPTIRSIGENRCLLQQDRAAEYMNGSVKDYLLVYFYTYNNTVLQQ